MFPKLHAFFGQRLLRSPIPGELGNIDQQERRRDNQMPWPRQSRVEKDNISFTELNEKRPDRPAAPWSSIQARASTSPTSAFFHCIPFSNNVTPNASSCPSAVATSWFVICSGRTYILRWPRVLQVFLGIGESLPIQCNRLVMLHNRLFTYSPS